MGPLVVMAVARLPEKANASTAKALVTGLANVPTLVNLMVEAAMVAALMMTVVEDVVVIHTAAIATETTTTTHTSDRTMALPDVVVTIEEEAALTVITLPAAVLKA